MTPAALRRRRSALPQARREQPAGRGSRPTLFDVPPGERHRGRSLPASEDLSGAGPVVAAADAEPTLDRLLVAAWSGLMRGTQVRCPLCSAAMEPRYDERATPIGGSCRECETTIG